jgi:hypothetical protein
MDRAGTVADDCPRNNRIRSDAGSIPAAALRRAICALPILNGCSPKVFDSLILNFFPLALVCTTKRRVWFRNV